MVKTDMQRKVEGDKNSLSMAKAKMEGELDKLYSETLKNLAEVDSKEARTAMESVQAMRGMALEAIQLRQEDPGERTESSNTVASQPMATPPSI